MRQLGDFATWLGLILLVLGVIVYTPRVVDYLNTEDATPRSGAVMVQRPPGYLAMRRHTAMSRPGFRPAAPASAPSPSE